MFRPVTPVLAADVVIRLAGRRQTEIVLIERHNPPHGWAIPGGFVDVGESVEQAAIREMREETGLEVTLEALLGVYLSSFGRSYTPQKLGTIPGKGYAARHD